MKKVMLLLAVLFVASSAILLAKGQKDEIRSTRELFEDPQQGELVRGMEGKVLWVEADSHKGGKLPLLETADAVYLLPFHRDLQEDMKLKVDAYILQPIEGAEISGFDYEGKKIVPALMVTMASDDEDNTLYLRGSKDSFRNGGPNNKYRTNHDRGCGDDSNRRYDRNHS